MTAFSEDMEGLAPVWILLDPAESRTVVVVADITDPTDHMISLSARLAKLEEAMARLYEGWMPLPAFDPDNPPYEAGPGQVWRQVPRKNVKLIDDQLVYIGRREGETG